MTIPTIKVNNIDTYQIPNVQNVYIPRWMTTQPNVDHLLPPVVVNIGNPIVNIPGCVKMHKDNKRHKNGVPIDKNLIEDDDGQAMTLCPDGSYPSYDAMNYEPEQMVMTYEQKAPVVPPPPEPEVNTPETPSIPKTGDEEVPCPGPNAPRIGDVAQNQKEKVSGYELQKDPANPKKEICVILYEDIGVVEAYLPSANVATTTAAIATVAGASALLAKPLADLLLRVFKPAIKQVLTKVNKILGKTPYRPTQSEIKTNEYRVKKGLVGINFAKRSKKKK
tara:strand:- start:34 stop:867 length:834 start_codon:yes stop_codon:yes gene_type:complete